MAVKRSAERRTAIVMIRLRPCERREADLAAKEAGTTVAGLAREGLLAAARAVLDGNGRRA